MKNLVDILVYDGDCPMCNRYIMLLDRMLKEKLYVTSNPQKAMEAGMLDERQKEKIMNNYRRTIIYRNRDTIYIESEAISKLFSKCGFTGKTLSLLISIFDKVKIARLIYRIVARNRNRIPIKMKKACALNLKNIVVI